MKLRVWMVFLLTFIYIEASTNITSMKDIRQANKGLTYLKKLQEQNTTKAKLKRYYLSKRMQKPSFFASYDEVHNLYLTAFLEKGTPLWLTDDTFVFHTSASLRYLKKLQDLYARKYKMNLGIHKNPQFKKTEYALRKIDTKIYARYIDALSASYLAKRDEKKQPKQSPPKQKKQKKLTVGVVYTAAIPAYIRSKKEIQLAQKAIDYLQEHKEDRSVALSKYILYKNVESPSIFSSKEPVYNLYLTAIVNGGKPKWLSDTKFVFHTSSSRAYLKKLQKHYKRKYNLKLSLVKNIQYKKEKSLLMSIDTDDLVAYLDAELPQEYKQKRQEKLQASEQKRLAKEEAQRKKEETKRKKKEALKSAQEEKNKKAQEEKAKLHRVIPAEIVTKKEAKRVQKGIVALEEQVANEAKAVKLKKYFLAQIAPKPSFFASMDQVYNLYLTALLQNGRPVWLEDERFVLDTSASYATLKKRKKFYKKRYHLDLTIYKNPTYKSEMLPLMDSSLSDVIAYVEAKTPEAYKQKENIEEKKNIKAQKAKRKAAQKRRAQQQKRIEAQNKAKEQKRAAQDKALKEKAAKEKQRKQEAKRKKEQEREKRKAEQKRKDTQKKRDKTLEQERRQRLEEIKIEKQRENDRLNEAALERQKKRQAKEQSLAQEQKAKEKTQREAKELEIKKAEEKQKALAKERAKIAAEKRRIAQEKKALEEEKRKIAQAKAAIAAEKKRAQELKAQQEAQARERQKAQTKKRAAQAEKRRRAEEKKRQTQKAKATAKKKKEDDLTSELDSMLKETSEYKEKLERSESIKYY